MPLIMGILAQAAAAPTPPAIDSDYDLLETEILTGSQASVTFSSLNSTYGADYQHLQIRLTARDSRAATGSNTGMQFNADTGANYSRHYLYGDGSIVEIDYGTNTTTMFVGFIASDNASANMFGASVIDILDPFETTKYTTIRALSGEGSTGIRLYSGSWRNTAALTSIKIEAQSSASYLTGSRFSLYGLKAA